VLAALVATAGSGLGACTTDRGTGVRGRGAGPEPAEPAVDPDVAVAAVALQAQTAIIALLRATRDRHPGLGELLAPVLAAHEAHAALLADAAPGEATPSATVSASPAGRRAGRPAVPARRVQAVRRLVAAEEDLTTAAKQQAFKAHSGAFARVLAAMAAAAAQNAAVLAPAARSGRTP
jgi:hypothetical protein